MSRIQLDIKEKEDAARLLTCQIYIAEGLRAVAGNTSVLVGGGSVLNRSLYDILYGNEPEEETRTSEEIVDHIKNKLSELGKEDG